MAKRAFRSEESIAAELATRARVEDLLEQHGLEVIGRQIVQRGTAITQVIDARLGDRAIRMHVRLCWRRDGSDPREELFSAAQLKARLDHDDWDITLANVAKRHARERYTHLLLVQDSEDGFVFAALLPSADIPAIWSKQREVSDNLITRGLAGNLTKNHAANGSSPTLWLQDDRHPETPTVARVIWDWPGVINVLALPRRGAMDRQQDTLDDLPRVEYDMGRDGAERVPEVRSGYPRNAKVRAAVLKRAGKRCERAGCGVSRDFGGFLDVHHILGIDVSDRVWTCVALCPNCHREAHFSPNRDALNGELRDFAAQFRIRAG